MLEVINLQKHYKTKDKKNWLKTDIVKAVDDISFILNKGERLGIIGESGSGKTTLIKTIVRLEDRTAGSVLYDKVDIYKLNNKKLKEYRKRIQIIFQDPYSSLNPRKKVRSIIGQAFYIHKHVKRNDIDGKIIKLLNDVGLSSDFINRYPHQLSGGQRQRIGIARALAADPELLICDEPVSALDISVQAQILNLLLDLQKNYNFTYIFISHDLLVIKYFATKIMVMYLGKVVEYTDKENLEDKYLHPYTQLLFHTFPNLFENNNDVDELSKDDGIPYSTIMNTTGCNFYPRCKFRKNNCEHNPPPVREVYKNHFVMCWLY